MKPKVSCLMVTRPVAERFSYFKRSIRMFTEQSYSNKELVVVGNRMSPKERSEARGWLESLGRADIRWHYAAGKSPPLGVLRNISMEIASGKWICQWDDDDLYHPLRIEAQSEALKDSKADAVFLSDVLHFVESERRLYWIDWRKAAYRCHPATLFASSRVKMRYDETGEASHSGKGYTGEDFGFLKKLLAEHSVHTLAGLPFLYIYTFTGKNIWSRSHHQRLLERFPVDSGRLRQGKLALRRELGHFDLGEGAIHLWDRKKIVSSW